MPTPDQATYSIAALVAAHTALRDVIDSGGDAGTIRIRSAADVLLAQVPLGYPCGTVDPVTGRLTLSVAGSTSAVVSGTAAYGQVCDSSGGVHLALPAEIGAVPQPGKLVMNTLTLLAGAPVAVFSATVG